MRESNQSTKQMAIVTFTSGGQGQSNRIIKCLQEPLGDSMWQIEYVHKPNHLQEWCNLQFKEKDAILFIGAMGIAVRTIAPFLQSKIEDPAVLVMDERGEYVIPLLSGHIGGGNELARLLAEQIGAKPVITTASDVNGKIAIDVFAKKNQLVIADMEKAKMVAAAIVEGRQVSFFCCGEVKNNIPSELLGEVEKAEVHVRVTPYAEKGENILYLIPKAFVLGIGCKQGKNSEEIEKRVLEELEQYQISIHSVASVATIDLKKQEKGLLDFCKKYKLPITFYTAEELKKVPGEFEKSEFVRSITGVDNVCERAAIRKIMEDNGPQVSEEKIVIKKSGKEGVTIALAKRDWSVEFE